MNKTSRKGLALLTIACILVTLCTPLTATAAGIDADGYILISNQAELDAMRNNLTGRYRLTNDIALTGFWTPIGASGRGKMFEGILDGQNYTITGLNISLSTGNVGLFGYTAGATIRNLNLDGGSVYSSNNLSYVGSIVGRVEGSLFLDNCASSVNVTGRYHVGGLVGRGEFDGARIQNCTYSGKVTGYLYTGGIIGTAEPRTTTTALSSISRCRVIINDPDITQAAKNQTERVTGTGPSTGGIAGSAAAVTIAECYTGIKIAGVDDVGGIVGTLSPTYSNSTISDCYSTGDITGDQVVGGIVGNTEQTTKYDHTIIRCYSTSNVSGRDNVGGIVGHNGTNQSYSEITRSVAINAEVRASSDSAGRVSGYGTAGNANNLARADLPIYWDGAYQTVSSASYGQHGANVDDVKLRAEYTDAPDNPYRQLGWNFDTIWGFDTAISLYPILQAFDYGPDAETFEGLAIEMRVGEIVRLRGMLSTFDLTGNVTWSSGNPTVANVDAEGNVAAMALGRTKIIMLDSQGAETSIWIAVKLPDEIPVGWVDIFEIDHALRIGETFQLAIDIRPNDATDKTLTWTSDTPSVVTVDGNGQVTGWQPGIATITATSNMSPGVSDSVTVTVRDWNTEVLAQWLDFRLAPTGVVGGTFSAVGLSRYQPQAGTRMGGQGWRLADEFDRKYWQVAVSTVGYDRVLVSSEQNSVAYGGARDFALEYSADGVDWFGVDNGAITVLDDNFTSGRIVQLPLESAGNAVSAGGQSMLYIRWRCISTTDAGGSADSVNNNAWSQIMNVTIEGQN